MKTKIIFLFALLILISMPMQASAQTIQDYQIAMMQDKIDTYNANTHKMPGTIKRIIGSEEILTKIEMTDNTTLYIYAATTDANITAFERIESPEGKEKILTIVTDETTIRSIMTSQDPLATFTDAMNTKKINIENTGFFKGIILWAMRHGLAAMFT